MFHVEHFVKQDICHNVFGHFLVIQLPVQHNLVERWVETAQLGSPDACAPSQTGAGKGTLEVMVVQSLKQRLQIMMRTSGPMLHPSCAALAHEQKMAARGSGIRELAVCFDQFGRRTPPVQTAQ
jgi:hypothetical protein